MQGEEIEKVAAYIREIAAAGADHVEIFRLCAERYPDMKKSAAILAIQIAMHDTAAEPDDGE